MSTQPHTDTPPQTPPHAEPKNGAAPAAPSVQPAAEPQAAPAPAITPCPYCGHVAGAPADRCEECGGLYEPLSRQASQNAMGPWFIRDGDNPHLPGCSYATLKRLAARGRLSPETVLRGPTTFQFWAFARDTPGVAHLLGACHNCRGAATASEFMCRSCGAVFTVDEDRQRMGLARVRLLPGSAPADVVARHEASLASEPAAPPRAASAPTKTSSSSSAAKSKPSGGSGSAPSSTAKKTPQVPDDASMRSARAMRRTIARLRIATAAATLFCAILLILLAASRSGGRETTDSAPQNTPPATLPRVEDLGKTTDSPPEWAQFNVEATRLAASDDPDDLSRALELLRRIRDEAPVVDQPADIATRIEELSRRLEAARLSKYAN